MLQKQNVNTNYHLSHFIHLQTLLIYNKKRKREAGMGIFFIYMAVIFDGHIWSRMQVGSEENLSLGKNVNIYQNYFLKSMRF